MLGNQYFGDSFRGNLLLLDVRVRLPVTALVQSRSLTKGQNYIIANMKAQEV